MRIRRLMLFLLIFTVSAVCLADPSASPLPDPAAAQPIFAQIWAWLMGHQIALGGFLVAVIDFLWALNPNWKSNTILHWAYLYFRKIAGLPDLPPA